MSRSIPVPSEPLLIRGGQINPIWWRYLQGLASQGEATDVQGQIRDILRRLSEIPESREVVGRMSVVVVDQPDGTRAVQLDGDSLTPGANAFYSTDQNGRRRWAPISQSIQAGSGISFTDSGYTVMGAVDSTDDLPPAGDDGQAWWVGNVLYAWDSVAGEWIPDYSPSGVLALGITPGGAPGDLLVWDGAEWTPGPGGGGIPDAPSDGTLYGRKDGAWAEVSGGVGPGAASLLLSSVDELGPEDAAELPDLEASGTLTAGALVYLVDAAGNSVRTTLGAIKSFINTDPTVVPSSNPWRGATVKRTADLSVPSSSATTVTWQAMSDGQTPFWSIGAPTRLVVPAGVTRVRVAASVRFAANATGNRSIYIMKNGAVFDGRGRIVLPAIAGEEIGIQCATCDVPVVAGDYFELVAFHSAGTSLALRPDTQTWFSLSVVEASP